MGHSSNTGGFSDREASEDVLHDSIGKAADAIIFCNIIMEGPNKYAQVFATASLKGRGTSAICHIVTGVFHGWPGSSELMPAQEGTLFKKDQHVSREPGFWHRRGWDSNCIKKQYH